MQPTYQFNFALLLGGVFATLSLTVMTWLTVGPVIAFTQLDNQPIVALESRLQEIDQQLSKLPHYSLRSGVGAIGFRSETHLDAEHQEWLKIDFGGEFLIDEIVLVPNLSREPASGFRAEGFPEQFRILAGTAADPNGRVIASYTLEDQLLPRIAPVVIPCNSLKPLSASWVKIESQRLTARQFDGRYLMQFSEISVFSGNENIALGRPVESSSNLPGGPAWAQKFAVDGFTPYLMNGAGGNESLAYVVAGQLARQPVIQVDLESKHIVNQINLHLVDQSDTVPQTHRGDYGVPGILRIEASSQADFSDPELLIETQHSNIFDIGPIIIRRFRPRNCRYIRFTAENPFEIFPGTSYGASFGFAEIEIMAHGKNVALGKTFASNETGVTPRSITALTDGNNYFGEILPIKKWLLQLANRHELESERPLVEAALSQRYQLQTTYVNRLIWLALLLSVGVLIAVVIGSTMRTRAVARTRDRIAADLHDELGANVHAIGLLADLAKSCSDSPQKLPPLMNRIREFTERAGTAATYCTNMLESKGLYDNLVNDMRHSSDRILADIEHTITVEGEKHLAWLKPRKRIDFFLFFKECLTNIIRHSNATKASTRLTADQHKIRLTVTDNGQGFANATNHGVPKSLKRRARFLGGVVKIQQSSECGTSVELQLRPSLLAKLRALILKP